MSSRSLGWLVALLLGGLLYLGLGPRRAPAVSELPALALEPAQEPAPVVLEPAVAVRRSTPVAPAAEPVTTPTAREFLAQYYGERWAEIEPKLTAPGLDEPYRFTPWESVAPEFARKVGVEPEHRAAMVRDQLRWAEPLDAAWLHERFPLGGWDGTLDEADLVAIQTLVEPLHEELRARAEILADRTELHLQEMWQLGTYQRAPFTTMGLAEARGFHSQSIGGYGWAVTLTLTREAFPDIEPLEKELLGLCEQRDLLVIRYLRERVRR